MKQQVKAIQKLIQKVNVNQPYKNRKRHEIPGESPILYMKYTNKILRVNKLFYFSGNLYNIIVIVIASMNQ